MKERNEMFANHGTEGGQKKKATATAANSKIW